ncbi:MAG: serine hydrolase domain-containing protein [bacterium]
MIPIQQQQHDIAGTVILVVKDGKVLFTKGYGFADVNGRTPVTDATLFRIGSVSKTFTWTAVMQLVEQGKIDLDRDVNTYIDFALPAPFGKPVTMRNLLTHTAGFEESIKDLFVAAPTDMTPLGVYLKTHVPHQIFPPGTTPAYSNYGATLAGYVVQRVSGMPFNDYINAHIFQPLGMTAATFAQPLPTALAPQMSSGYALASGKAKAYELVQAWPAGSMAVSADAMSHFMIAHLEDGQYAGARILKPATVREMHSRLFGANPALNGMAHGFYEETRNGQAIVGHGGDTQWFHSDLHLVPGMRLGFFISSNSAGKGGDLRGIVWKGFLDRYFPYTPPVAAPPHDRLADARSVVGRYYSSRRIETVSASVIGLMQTTVSVNADSTISNDAQKDPAGNPKRYQEIAPLVFREVHGQSLLAFAKDFNGDLAMGADYPFEVDQRVPARKAAPLNFLALGVAVGAFLLTLLCWPLAGMLRRHYRAFTILPQGYSRLRLIMRVTCFTALLFLALRAKLLASISSDISAVSSSNDGYVHVLQVIGFAAMLGLPVAIAYCALSWRTGALWVWSKVWNTILAVGFVAFALFVLNWHLLST